MIPRTGLAIAFCAALALAETAFPLEHVRITGNQRVPVEKILDASGLKIGAKVTKADFDAARERLMASGAFENVGYAYKPSADNAGFDATIEVVEIEHFYPYRFEDLPVADAPLRASLHKLTPLLGDEIPVTNQVLDHYIAAVQAAVGDKIKVAANLNSDLPGGPMIVFRPNIPRDRVAEVKFIGNQIVPADALVHAFAQAAMGTEYSEAAVRAMLDASVRPLYDARGRLRVSFTKIETHPSMFAEGVRVVVTVNEGEPYSLGEVKLAGIDAADLPEMQKLANLQPKDVADFDEIKAASNRVLDRYRAQGYMRASAKSDRVIDDARHTVAVTLTFARGPIFKMRNLEILGLDKTSEPQIRKMWRLNAGEIYRGDYPNLFLDEVRRAQIFDNLGPTHSEAEIDDAARAVDVKLYFSPSP